MMHMRGYHQYRGGRTVPHIFHGIPRVLEHFPRYSRHLQQCLRLGLHGEIYRPDSFVLVPRYCANLKAIRYESTSLNRIVGDKSHRVIVA